MTVGRITASAGAAVHAAALGWPHRRQTREMPRCGAASSEGRLGTGLRERKHMTAITLLRSTLPPDLSSYDQRLKFLKGCT